VAAAGCVVGLTRWTQGRYRTKSSTRDRRLVERVILEIRSIGEWADMYALVVRFDVIPERLAEFDALVDATIAGIREHEDGTLAYLSSTVDTEPGTRVFIEVYRDKAAFEAHETTAHTRRFLEQRQSMLRGFHVDFLNPVAAKFPGLGMTTG
jgi:quinol monooxygenase YgiN